MLEPLTVALMARLGAPSARPAIPGAAPQARRPGATYASALSRPAMRSCGGRRHDGGRMCRPVGRAARGVIGATQALPKSRQGAGS